MFSLVFSKFLAMRNITLYSVCRNIIFNKGLNPTDSCEVFEEVTIVFSDVPDFMDICSKCDPFQIVNLLNTMFGLFDYLSDENDIYKLETVKDSFVGVSGAPERIKNHAEKIIDMALDMRDCVTFVQDPRLKGNGGKKSKYNIKCSSAEIAHQLNLKAQAV